MNTGCSQTFGSACNYNFCCTIKLLNKIKHSMYHVRMNRAEGVDMEEFHPGTIPQEGTRILTTVYISHIATSYIRLPLYVYMYIVFHSDTIPIHAVRINRGVRNKLKCCLKSEIRNSKQYFFRLFP